MPEFHEDDAFSPENLTPQQYLEKIGRSNSNNVLALQKAINEITKADKLDMFFLAVGGTVKHKDILNDVGELNRKDIDTIVDIEYPDFEENLPQAERYRRKFAFWQQKMAEAIKKIDPSVIKDIEVYEPRTEKGNDLRTDTYGKIVLTPIEGKPLDILCYQEGTPIKAPFVPLYSDVDFKLSV